MKNGTIGTTESNENEPSRVLTPQDLENFTGSQGYTREVYNLLITDGVKCVRDTLKANWLISDISSVYNFHDGILNNRKENKFLLVKLKINRAEKDAFMEIREDTDTPVLYSQKYQYTDIIKYFSGDELNFYLIDGVLLLPSEY